MKLLNTYDDKDEAEESAEKLQGQKRLASERDSTVVICNLFGIPSWGNLHRRVMYDLAELGGCLTNVVFGGCRWCGMREFCRHCDTLPRVISW